MEIKIIKHSSPDYEQLVQLRIKTLLDPIGVPASYIVKEKEKDDTFIAAFENNEIIGCCVLTKIDNDTIQLRQMAVNNDQQGKGIGAAIVDYAEAVAKENGYSILMMHARDPVIDFYKKCGYQIVGEQFFEVGIGHHKLEKKLE